MTLEVKPNPSQLPVCLYHCPCMDGLIAAAIVHHHFKGEVECIPVSYKPSSGSIPDRIIDAIKGRDVYLVDFTFTPQDLVPVIHLMKSLTIIDHHHAADDAWLSLDAGIMPALPETKESWSNDEVVVWYQLISKFHNDRASVPVNLVLNSKHSGAALTWMHFNEPIKKLAKLPILVDYAQAYDLWTKHLLPQVDEFQLGFTSRFPLYTTPAQLIAETFSFDAEDSDFMSTLIKEGSTIRRYESALCDAIISRNVMHETVMGVDNIPTCPSPMELVNTIGEKLYTKFPDAPFVLVYEDYRSSGMRKLCFRSRKNGGSNVAELAQQVGGNGHANSAGAKVAIAVTYRIQPLVPPFVILD